MKHFNTFAEALLITTAKPESDSVGPVIGSEQECQPCQKDMLTQAADDAMSVLGGEGDETMQPDDGIGEFGELGDSMESSGDDVEFECLGDEGLIVKFSGTAILLPKNVVEKIKSYEPEENSENSEDSENDEEGEENGDSGESEESDNDSESSENSEDSEESEESNESEDNDEEDDDKGEKKSSKAFDINESVKNPKAVCAASMDMGKKKGKGTKEAQAKRKAKFERCVSSVSKK